MGGNQSILERSTEDIQNFIVQTAEQNCINTVLSTSDIKVSVINSTLFGDLNIERVNLINGVSCTLRATFDNELINRQTNIQFGEIADEREDDTFGAGTLIRNLLPWSAAVNFAESMRNQNFTSESIQKVINEVTQQINSSCQNRVANENAPIDISIVDSKIKGNTNITDEQKISNTSCIIENMTRNYVRNDQENDQSATLKRSDKISGLSFLIFFIIIIIIFVVIGTVLSHGASGLLGGGKGKK